MDWAIEYHVEYSMLKHRIDRGATLEQALANSQHGNSRLLTFRGETKSLRQWAEQFKIKPATLSKRLCDGWSVEEALTIPVGEKRK